MSRRVADAGGKLIVMPHGDVAIVREAKRLGCSCACRASRRRPKPSRRSTPGADGLKMFPAEQLSPAALKAWRAVLPKRRAGVPGRRHPPRQHGAVLGSRRQRLRHRLESVHAGRDSG